MREALEGSEGQGDVLSIGPSTRRPACRPHFLPRPAPSPAPAPAVVVNQASIETVFSKKLSQYADVVGDNVGKLMGAYFMAVSGE